MASVYKNGRRWRGSVVMPNGRRLTKTFDLQADANRWARNVETEIDRGTWGAVVNRKVTLGEYADGWLAAQDWRPTTRDNTERHVHRHINPTFGEQAMATITNTQIQAWVTMLTRTGAAPRSVRGYYRTLASILAAAVADGVIATNPATTRRIRLPQPETRTSHSPLTVLTLEQLHKLADAMPPHLKAFLWVGAAAGLRPGETAGLTVDALDLEAAELSVVRQMSTSSAGTRLAPPKTRASIRTVPIPTQLVDELARHMADHPPIDFEGHRIVFTTELGGPHNRTSYTTHWARARKRLRLDPGEYRGFHDLRHFYASALIAGGSSVKTVQTLLGHASAVETLDTYSHLWPDSDVGARTAITEALLLPSTVPGGQGGAP